MGPLEKSLEGSRCSKEWKKRTEGSAYEAVADQKTATCTVKATKDHNGATFQVVLNAKKADGTEIGASQPKESSQITVKAR